jgi:hypothetical protein
MLDSRWLVSPNPSHGPKYNITAQREQFGWPPTEGW